MKFSVLLPTHDRLEYLAYAIETVRRQDYSDWEVIVSDNFSSEGVCGYVEKLGDARIRCVRTAAFVPVTDNWNNALHHSSGDFVVMLGDDDGLLPQYFSSMSRLISAGQQPVDFVYSGAYIFAYPGTIPGEEAGFLDRVACPGDDRDEAFWMSPEEARAFVADSLRFRMRYPFNMQHSLISRKLIEELEPYGPFFQSPYPDFYATNAMFVKAARILVDPAPRVVIGVTPKSYGFYHFSKEEAAGAAFLNNAPGQAVLERLRDTIISGNRNYTSWLLAMECLKARFGSELPAGIAYGGYRLRQILHVCKNRYLDEAISDADFSVARSQMRSWEKVAYGAPLRFAFSATRWAVPRRFRGRVVEALRPLLGQLVPHSNSRRTGEFGTVLDVFDRLSRQHA